MVRAQAVDHPGEWDAAGYHELTGNRQRYRILDFAVLMRCLEMPGRPDSFRNWYEATIQKMAGTGYLCREPHWTQATAVGSRSWIESLADKVVIGRRMIEALNSMPTESVGEEETSYALTLSTRQSSALWQS